MSLRTSAAYIATSAAAALTLTSAQGNIFAGLYISGSAGGTTITIKDGTTTVLVGSATTAEHLLITPMPIACKNGLVTACSGTGSYTVFFYK